MWEILLMYFFIYFFFFIFFRWIRDYFGQLISQYILVLWLQRQRQIEAINGAWAMIGLTAGLVIESRTGKGILAQVKLLSTLSVHAYTLCPYTSAHAHTWWITCSFSILDSSYWVTWLTEPFYFQLADYWNIIVGFFVR